MRTISKVRLRDDIVGQLIELIVDGELPEVGRLKEVELANKLGVSRTPLREALLLLERDGLVVSEANKGFRVAPLSVTRVRELFPILGSLEALAIRQGGAALVARAPELRAANRQIRAGSRRKRYLLDYRFHELLWEGCSNHALVDLLRRIWLEARRFDGSTERGMASPAGSIRDHDAIARAIGRGDHEEAATLVEDHWRTGVSIVVDWLGTRRVPSTVLLPTILIALAAHGTLGCSSPPVHAPRPIELDKLGYFVDETKALLLVERESRAHRPETVAFEHIGVVSMAHAGVDADRTMIVSGGMLVAIGDPATTPIPAGAKRVDGRGRFVMPGLVDMHVHTELASADYLLDLANGVTSVREMDGYPWLLAQRARANANQLLIPNLYVAGHILASQPLSWYATVVTTPAQAREVVRQQRSAGYDFIKVHNIVTPAVYDAICDEARKLGIDVVGHIPHGITVARAVACGQRTFEHFKGYIDDRSLTLARENYVDATKGADVWNTPTMFNYRDHIRGDEARAVLERPEMRYAPARDRKAWLALANEPPKAIQLGVLPMQQQIFRELMPTGAHFLAGTDAGGGYPYEVRGFALHDELALMADQGMAAPDVLRTATIEPARAMRRVDFGTVEVGKRADLLVLHANPLDAVANTSVIDGVMVRGVWLPRADLDAILDAIAEIAATTAPPTRAQLDRALDELEKLRAHGAILRDHFLGWLRYRLDKAGISTNRPLFVGITSVVPDE